MSRRHAPDGTSKEMNPLTAAKRAAKVRSRKHERVKKTHPRLKKFLRAILMALATLLLVALFYLAVVLDKANAAKET